MKLSQIHLINQWFKVVLVEKHDMEAIMQWDGKSSWCLIRKGLTDPFTGRISGFTGVTQYENFDPEVVLVKPVDVRYDGNTTPVYMWTKATRSNPEGLIGHRYQGSLAIDGEIVETWGSFVPVKEEK